jgi:hypothetical protein
MASGRRFSTISFNVFQPELRDDLDERMHFVRIDQKIAQRILKGHQHVQLLENTRAHNGHRKVFRGVDGRLVFLRGLPPRGAVGPEIRYLYIFLPCFDIPDDLIFLRDNGYGGRLILRERNVCTPAVIGICAAYTVASEKLKDGIPAHRLERPVAVCQPIRPPVFFYRLPYIGPLAEHNNFPPKLEASAHWALNKNCTWLTECIILHSETGFKNEWRLTVIPKRHR